MDANFFLVFDAIIGILGLYLTFISIKAYKNKEVDPMLINAEELVRCNDVPGLSRYLMPKCGIFGGFCVIFGIQGLLGDTGVIDYPRWVSAAFLIAFVAIYIVFVYFLTKAKKTYIH